MVLQFLIMFYFLKPKDIMLFHKRIHEELGISYDNTHAILSIDGVQESKTTSRSLHMYTMRFAKCRSVYTSSIVRNKPGHKVDYMQMLDRIVKDCK